jgi:TATA-box binding protein (TBP) (component of TFIID and TFIIIB)
MTSCEEFAKIDDFHSTFSEGYKEFQHCGDDDTETHISTMTFTSKLNHCKDTIYAYLLSLTPDSIQSKGLLGIPNIRPSTFSRYAVDITPFPNLCEQVTMRLFCTTGSILTTGCSSHLMCLTALDELIALLSRPEQPAYTYTLPQCRLINANCSLETTLRMDTLVTSLRQSEMIDRVETPERHAAVIVRLRDPEGNKVKVMVYASGKYSIHGTSYQSMLHAKRVCRPFFHESRGIPTVRKKRQKLS